MRSVILATAVTFAAVSLALADPAGATMKKQYVDVPAQDLGAALQQLMKDHELHVVYISEDLRNLRTGGVKGDFTASEALDQLLSGTGLTYQYLDDKTVTIVPLATAPAAHEDRGAQVLAENASSAAGRSAAASRHVEQPPSTVSGTSKGFWQRLAQAAEGQAGVPAAAGESAAEQEVLQEITVTAQKRVERLQDVPISISVLGGEQLDSSSDKGVMEALTKVPGVGAYEGFQTGGASIQIRGVTATGPLAGGSSPVGYYIDSVPFALARSAISPDVNAYDLERVEVLRGPQGTLFGAGSQNGTVRVLTRRAESNRFQAKARTSASSIEDGGTGYRGDLAVNVPLIEGKLATRWVAGYQKVGGWIDKPNDKDANEGEILNLRARVDADPTENLSVSLTSWISRSDLDSFSGGLPDETSRSTSPEPIATDFDSFGFGVSYDFSGFTVTSTTSYLDYRLRSALDAAAATSGTNILTSNIDAQLFAQELILTSRGEGPWRWTLGAMYRDAEDIQFQVRRNRFTGAAVNPYVVPTEFTSTSESVSVFGELTRLLADGAFELTAGLRYFRDDVGIIEHSRLTGDPSSFPPGTPQALPLLSPSPQTFDKVSPRAVVAYHPGDDSTIYISYAEGFRSGFQQQPSILIFDPSFSAVKPDNLTNYELGAKADLFDGLVAVDGAVYFMDWEGVQLPVTVPVGTALLPAIVNAASASGLGIDAGVALRPARGLTLGASLSINDLTLDDDVLTATNVVVFREGDRTPTSPRATAGLTLDYQFPIGNGFGGRFSVGSNYSSERTIVTQFLTGYVISEGDKYWLTNTRFTLESERNWELSLFIDNVADKRGLAQVFSFPAFFPEWNNRIRPRTVGLQFDWHL